jgi:hypothetical protein
VRYEGFGRPLVNPVQVIQAKNELVAVASLA